MFEPGKRYRTRSGDAVISGERKPRANTSILDEFPWLVTTRDKQGRTYKNWYTETGRWTLSQESELDLIEEVSAHG